MKASSGPRTVAITGASAGLGQALALAYARPGRMLILMGRDSARLAVVAAACRARDAIVHTGEIDVTDAAGLAAFLKHVSQHGEIELLIANAGVFTGHGANAMETPADVAWMNRVNLEGVVNTVDAMLKLWTYVPPDGRQIAIVGSLAALQPLADAPGYSASKAAVMSYGEALREYLVPRRILVTLIYPGHIATAQVADHVGPLPNMMTPEAAASLIKRGLDERRAFIAFPWQLLWLIRLGRLLPWRLRALAGQGLRFHVKRPGLNHDTARTPQKRQAP